MSSAKRNIVFLDLETGGLNPHLHQITQIGAVAVEAETLDEVGESFERKVSLVEGKWTQEALDSQRFSIPAWDKEGVPITTALDDLHKWYQPYLDERVSRAGRTYKAVDVGGFNVKFDADFLRATAKRCSIRLDLALWTGGMFDVLQLAKWCGLKTGEKFKNFRLETLCKARGIHYDAHDAAEDARATVTLAQSFLVGF